MKSSEYERRRRALEEQMQADLELIRAGHQAKLRALERLWLGSVEGDGQRPVQNEAALSETVQEETGQVETVHLETVADSAPGAETPTVVPRDLGRRRDVLGDLEDALPHLLPEIFEKRDIYQALGYTPARATLYRAISILQREQRFEIARESHGGTRTLYRKPREP